MFGRCLLKRSCPTTPPSARYAASPSVVRSEACLARQNYPCHRRWLRDGRDHAAIRQVENWWCGDAALNLSARSSLDRARHLNRRSRSIRAVARYAGLTGSPDDSGLKSREKGLAKAGNARVRRGLIQLAWRFLMFQKDSALARWYRTRTEGPSGARKTTMIVALARKLLIALWRLVTTGEVPDGVELRPAA